MRIVIADDEYLVRVSLKSMLLELNLPLEIVGEAKNGEELFNLIKEQTPDVAFVDIRMPKLTGLEAIEKSKSLSPDTKWIILTGFSEFHFAKESIKLGASNYLLKPVSPEELQEAVNTIFKFKREYYSKRNSELENDLIALVHDLGTFLDNDEVNCTSKVKYLSSIFIFDSSLNEKEKSIIHNRFYKAVRTIINELSTNDTRIALFPMSNGDLVTVCECSQKNSEKSKYIAKTYFKEVLSLVNEFNRDNFFITVLRAQECTSFESLNKSLKKLQELSFLRIIISHEKGLTMDELISQYQNAPPDLIRLCNLLIKFSYAYKEKIYLNYIKSLEDIEKILATSKEEKYNYLKQPIMKFLLHTINFKYSIDKDVHIVIIELKEHGENLLAEIHKEENSSYIISHIKSFIEQNYMKDIGIGQIAEELKITPNYLSTLFHRKTGITFMKYLTKIRMLKSKELLSNSGMQVQQVSEQVGYYSTRYFTKLFKEFYGYYPSEYRLNLKSNKAL